MTLKAPPKTGFVRSRSAFATHPASPHEATLAEATLDQIVLDHAPERLIGDLSWVLRSAIGENSGHGIGDQRGRLLRIMGHPELRRGRNGLLECTRPWCS